MMSSNLKTKKATETETETETSSRSSNHRPYIYLARNKPTPRGPLYLPEGYKRRTHTTVDGVAKSGEISPKGTVTHTEDWEGRVAATAAPATIVYKRDPDGTWRPMTKKEMIERGFFVPGKGPRGVTRPPEGETNE